jgi:MarR-like DNA-binding transcriptional regulator SgrR of sgrS sRNA
MSPQGRDTEFTLSDVTEVFESREDYAEPLTASEIADRLDCSRRTALNKLH